MWLSRFFFRLTLYLLLTCQTFSRRDRIKSLIFNKGAAEIKTFSEVISYETPAPRGQVKLVPADGVAKLVELLHTEARVI